MLFSATVYFCSTSKRIRHQNDPKIVILKRSKIGAENGRDFRRENVRGFRRENGRDFRRENGRDFHRIRKKKNFWARSAQIFLSTYLGGCLPPQETWGGLGGLCPPGKLLERMFRPTYVRFQFNRCCCLPRLAIHQDLPLAWACHLRALASTRGLPLVGICYSPKRSICWDLSFTEICGLPAPATCRD